MTDCPEIPAHLDRRGDPRLSDAEVARLVDISTGRKREWVPMGTSVRAETSSPSIDEAQGEPSAAERAAEAFPVPPVSPPVAATKPPWSAPVANRKLASTVWVDGREFHSVKVAFEKLKLPMPKRQKFRAALKKAGKLAFVWEGKSYGFVTEAMR